MGRLYTILLLLSFINAGLAQTKERTSTDKELQSKLEALIKDFEGEVGLYIHHLKKDVEVAINADDTFPTASMIKVPIMLTLFSKIEAGELNYGEELIYKDSLFYSDEDILGGFKDGQKISLSRLVMLMITMSDNTASLWCQELAGSGTEINNWLKAADMKTTRMNSRTPGRQKDWEKYGWGQTSPREMAKLVEMIGTGNAISKAASSEMYKVMGNIYWNSEALSQLPLNIATISKQGAVSQSRSEVVLVNAPSGDYVFCLITKNQSDTSWEHDNAGYQLLRDASRIVWDHFEPDHKYVQPEGYLKFVK